MNPRPIIEADLTFWAARNPQPARYTARWWPTSENGCSRERPLLCTLTSQIACRWCEMDR